MKERSGWTLLSLLNIFIIHRHLPKICLTGGSHTHAKVLAFLNPEFTIICTHKPACGTENVAFTVPFICSQKTYL